MDLRELEDMLDHAENCGQLQDAAPAAVRALREPASQPSHAAAAASRPSSPVADEMVPTVAKE